MCSGTFYDWEQSGTRRIYVKSIRMTLGFESLGPLAHPTDASYSISVPRAKSLPAASFGFRLRAAPPCSSVRSSCHQGLHRDLHSTSHFPTRFRSPDDSVRSWRCASCLMYQWKRPSKWCDPFFILLIIIHSLYRISEILPLLENEGMILVLQSVNRFFRNVSNMLWIRKHLHHLRLALIILMRASTICMTWRMCTVKDTDSLQNFLSIMWSLRINITILSCTQSVSYTATLLSYRSKISSALDANYWTSKSVIHPP
jgi:hypothetical protein